MLKSIKDVELSEYFITSKAQANPMTNDDKLFTLEGVDGIKALVKKAKGNKCSRCWIILDGSCKRTNCALKN